MSNLILQAPELNAVEQSKAEKIRLTFEPMAEMLEKFEGKYNEVVKSSETEINYDLTQKAKRVRLDIAKIRIETGKLKDKQKEYIKLEDKAIMGVHNLLVWAVKEKEDKLKEIERHFEIQEQKRLEVLQREREELISHYLEDAHERDLSGMEQDVWESYFQAKKQAHEDRIEAERRAEQERMERQRLEQLLQGRQKTARKVGSFFEWDNLDIETTDQEWTNLMEAAEKRKAADDQEREKIRKENERLEAERKEAESKAKAEAEKRDKEERERKERERKEREAYEAKVRKEAEAKAKAEAEAKAREEAIAKAKAEEKARKEAELKKGDADKVKDLLNDLEVLKTKYTFKSDQNKKMMVEVAELLSKIQGHIQK